MVNIDWTLLHAHLMLTYHLCIISSISNKYPLEEGLLSFSSFINWKALPHIWSFHVVLDFKM